jgi:hypothetical protein
MDFRATTTDPVALQQYAQLFRACFPTASHLDVPYLQWLYGDNPAGPVVGMDAWEGERLAAHYVCVPAHARLFGRDCRVLLSLNTATHPDFQGKGLFTRLADQTYVAGATQGFDAVYGVANANSTPGFLKKLGFALVSPLEARVGVGRIDRNLPDDQMRASAFHRRWDASSLGWRCANPARPYRIERIGEGALGASAATGKPGLRAWAELPAIEGFDATSSASWSLRLHLGLRPAVRQRRGAAWIDLPGRLRASPLNLIFRGLREGVVVPASDAIYFGQLDFDAF